MQDSTLITITDVGGSKSYNLSKFIKRFITYFVIIVAFTIAIGFWIISSLNTKVNKLSTQSNQLKIQNQELETKNKLYSMQIADKVKDIEELSDTLKDIEDVLGVEGNDNTSLIKRATLAKITSKEKSYIFEVIPNGSPLKITHITDKYGWRIHPITKQKTFHNGLDLKADRQTDVFSTADGVIKYVQNENKGNYGRMIIISHNFGFETVYAHLRYVEVKAGDVIRKGQVIGKSGNSGRSTGPHLHYEVRFAGKVLNPLDFVTWDMKNYENIFKIQRRVSWDSLVNLINIQNKKIQPQ